MAAIDREAATQFAALGVALDGMAAEPADGAIEVWDVHWTAFEIFRACGTQWRVAIGGTTILHLGLDYPGVAVVMDRLLPADAEQARVFADLQVMEAAAQPILNGSET